MKDNPTVFHILDLDRTLLDTSKLAQCLKEIIASHDIKLSQDIDTELTRHAQEQKSFFIFEYIAKRNGYDKLNNYIDELNYSTPSCELLLPGVAERIAFARSQPGWSMGILTYGSPSDQNIKLKLAGLQAERRLVIDVPHKGKLIASWKLPNGKYKLPVEFGGHTVDILTLDDDKLIAFKDLPEDVLGQWVTNASIGGSVEMQKLPANIRLVSNLEGSVAYLKTKLTAS